MSIDVHGYIDTTIAPWGKLFYRLVWKNIPCTGKHVLDFGSGLGITANHLAQDNEVIAIEPNVQMIEHRIKENHYKQINGSSEALKDISDHSIDAIICHNVFEYMDVCSREKVLQEFVRLLKADGYVSVIKHHRIGKIMQKAIFDNNVSDALKLLNNEEVESVNFGTIHEYEESELVSGSRECLSIDRVYGLRTFYGLQRNEWKYEDTWLENMYKMECAVEEVPEFRSIAFFHHIILRPMCKEK